MLRGQDFVSGTASAPPLPSAAPLPIILLGTSLTVQGSDWARRKAGLYLVSPDEIRFQIPEETVLGAARVIVERDGMELERLGISVSAVAPGLFSANGDGKGVAAASAVRIARDGTETPMDVARYDPILARYVAVPIDLGSSVDSVYLRLYGTGIRGASGTTGVEMGGIDVVMVSSGPSSVVRGVDEVLVGPLPESLAHTVPDIVVTVDGQASNAVSIAVK